MSAMGLEGEGVAGRLGLEQSERTRLGGSIGAGGSTSSPGKNKLGLSFNVQLGACLLLKQSITLSGSNLTTNFH